MLASALRYFFLILIISKQFILELPPSSFPSLKGYFFNMQQAWGLALNLSCRVGSDSSKYVSEMAAAVPDMEIQVLAPSLDGNDSNYHHRHGGDATGTDGVSNRSPRWQRENTLCVRRIQKYFYCRSTRNNDTMDLFSKAFSPRFQKSHPKTFLKCLKLIQNQSLRSVLHWLLNPLPHCFPVKGWTGSRIRSLVHPYSVTARPTGGVCNDPRDTGQRGSWLV